MSFHRSISLGSYSGPKLQVVGNFGQKFAFFEKKKQPLMGKFSKFCSERIHHLTDACLVCKFCEIWLTGNRQSRALLTGHKKKQKFISLSHCCFITDRTQDLLWSAVDDVLRVPQILSKWVHCRQSNSRMREHRRNAPQNISK